MSASVDQNRPHQIYHLVCHPATVPVCFKVSESSEDITDTTPTLSPLYCDISVPTTLQLSLWYTPSGNLTLYFNSTESGKVLPSFSSAHPFLIRCRAAIPISHQRGREQPPYPPPHLPSKWDIIRCLSTTRQDCFYKSHRISPSTVSREKEISLKSSDCSSYPDCGSCSNSPACQWCSTEQGTPSCLNTENDMCKAPLQCASNVVGSGGDSSKMVAILAGAIGGGVAVLLIVLLVVVRFLGDFCDRLEY